MENIVSMVSIFIKWLFLALLSWVFLFGLHSHAGSCLFLGLCGAFLEICHRMWMVKQLETLTKAALSRLLEQNQQLERLLHQNRK